MHATGFSAVTCVHECMAAVHNEYRSPWHRSLGTLLGAAELQRSGGFQVCPISVFTQMSDKAATAGKLWSTSHLSCLLTLASMGRSLKSQGMDDSHMQVHWNWRTLGLSMWPLGLSLAWTPSRQDIPAQESCSTPSWSALAQLKCNLLYKDKSYLLFHFCPTLACLLGACFVC